MIEMNRLSLWKSALVGSLLGLAGCEFRNGKEFLEKYRTLPHPQKVTISELLENPEYFYHRVIELEGVPIESYNLQQRVVANLSFNSPITSYGVIIRDSSGRKITAEAKPLYVDGFPSGNYHIIDETKSSQAKRLTDNISDKKLEEKVIVRGIYSGKSQTILMGEIEISGRTFHTQP